eukprot:7385215-Prymnesium_polylepis.1
MGFSRLFTGGAGRRRLFRAFLLFSGCLYAFDSLAGAFDSPSKRGTSTLEIWLGPSAEAGARW